MAPLTLLLAACALAAPLHAASIPDRDSDAPALLPGPAEPADEPAKEPTDTSSNAEDIPVAVVLEAAEPSIKLNEIDDVEIQRPAVDLRNPGPPQRQEHETQNPEQHSDEWLKASSIRESIERTRDVLTQSLRDTSANVQDWLSNKEDQTGIQKSIQSLRDTFTSQIQKLNDTIHTLMKSEEQVHPKESMWNFEVIGSRLKSLQDNINNGVETLSAGVELAALLKSSADDSETGREDSSTPSAVVSSTVSPGNVVSQFFGNFTQAVQTTFQGLLNQMRPTTPPSVQADTPNESTTQQPALGWISNVFTNLQNFSLPFSNIQQSLQQSLPQSILPFTLSSLWSSSTTTAKPTEASSTAADQPVKADQAEAEKPTSAAVVEASTQPGPIRQFLSNIPVVQRIQSSLGNRDTPRQPAAAPAAPAAPAEPAAPDAVISGSQTKGGWYGGPRPGGSGNSNNSDGLSEQRSEEVKAPHDEEIKKDTEEPKPEPVADKTE